MNEREAPVSVADVIAEMRSNVKYPDERPDMIWGWRVDSWADRLEAALLGPVPVSAPFTEKELWLIASIVGDKATECAESEDPDMSADVPTLRGLSIKAQRHAQAPVGPVPVSEGQEECPTCGGCVTVTYPTIGEPVYKAAVGSPLPGPPPPTCSKCRTSWSANGVYICPECGWSQPYRADVPQAGGPVPGGAPPPSMADAAEMLWVVLANVSGGDWTKQTPEWQEAAARWRDNYFAALRGVPAPPGAGGARPLQTDDPPAPAGA